MFVVDLRRVIKKMLVFLGVILTVYLILNSRWYLKRIYPTPYEDLVTRYSVRYDVDPFLVTAVMRVESRFRPGALSIKGARGLMQIMPDTGIWIAGQLGIEMLDPEVLYDPEINLNIGTWYLSLLLKEYTGDLVMVLAAYNAGRGNVNRWIEDHLWSGRKEDINDIPFPETREYVKSVLHLHKKYRYIYKEQWDKTMI